MRSHNYLVVISICCLLFGCQQKEPANIYQVYGDVLDQLMTERYFYNSLSESDPFIDSTSKAYWRGEINSETYQKLGDSLIKVRKRSLPKYVLDYDTVSIYTQYILHDSITTRFLLHVFKEKSVKENFDISFKTFTDSLSRPFTHFNKIKIDYLSIIPYQKSNGPFGKELGRFTFSKVIFNSTFDKAILYYDIHISGKNGEGEALFIELEDNKWRIKEHHEFWIS